MKKIVICYVIAVAALFLSALAIHETKSNLNKMADAAKIMRGYGIDVGYRGE